MRSGSSEFARDLAHAFGWRNAGEPFNFPPWGVRTSKDSPVRFLDELAQGRRLVFKLFIGHTRRPLPDHCAVVLERTNVRARWCSLLHAQKSHDWTGRVRHNCTDYSPPTRFVAQHAKWYRQVRSRRKHLYLTFDDIVNRRNESLCRVRTFCDAG